MYSWISSAVIMLQSRNERLNTQRALIPYVDSLYKKKAQLSCTQKYSVVDY